MEVGRLLEHARYIAASFTGAQQAQRNGREQCAVRQCIAQALPAPDPLDCPVQALLEQVGQQPAGQVHGFGQGGAAFGEQGQ
ncbi:hypothetical protein D3C76_1727220 [compost metagenome]